MIDTQVTNVDWQLTERVREREYLKMQSSVKIITMSILTTSGYAMKLFSIEVQCVNL